MLQITGRELALGFTIIAWMYSYLQWGLLKAIPLGYLMFNHQDVLGQMYFGLNMVGDIFLHYDCLRLGILNFYLCYAIIIFYMLKLNNHSQSSEVLMAMVAAFIPSIWSSVYSILVYGVISIYGLALSIPFSSKGDNYIAESFLLLLVSDVLVLGQILGWTRLQPFTLTIYYLSRQIMSWSKLDIGPPMVV